MPRVNVRMDRAEAIGLLRERRNMAVATIGRDGQPHLTVVSYLLADEQIQFWTYSKSQKAVNLRRDSRLTCLIDVGDGPSSYAGVMVNGRARLISRPQEVLEFGRRLHHAWSDVLQPRIDDAVVASAARGRVVIAVEALRTSTWTHRKTLALPEMQDPGGPATAGRRRR